MVDPVIHLVGWTCSVAGFAPITMINGPIRRDIGLNCGNNLLSGYNKPNAAPGNICCKRHNSMCC